MFYYIDNVHFLLKEIIFFSELLYFSNNFCINGVKKLYLSAYICVHILVSKLYNDLYK